MLLQPLPVGLLGLRVTSQFAEHAAEAVIAGRIVRVEAGVPWRLAIILANGSGQNAVGAAAGYGAASG